MEKWDSLFIYCFSGTGNALVSSKWIASEADKRGIKVVVQEIDKTKNIIMPDENENSLIGFAFPTHGFNAAPIMIRFITGFPKGLCKEIFLLNTRAGMKLYKIFMPGISGIALLVPALLLRVKGYRCIGYRPVDLPSNWIPLHPGLRKKVIDSIFIRCEKIVRNFANKIFSGRKVYRGLFSIPIDLLISPIALGYYIGGRFFLAKTFIANNKCDNCGICIRNCPTSSIKLVGNRSYWKLTCESCMRCLNHCPQRAIEAAHGMATAFILLIATINTWLFMFILDILNVSPDVWWWKISSFFIGTSVMVVIATILYRIIHAGMSFKPIRYLVWFTSFTTLPFWRRYIFPKNMNNFSHQNHKK